jgi:hypothetical protein
VARHLEQENDCRDNEQKWCERVERDVLDHLGRVLLHVARLPAQRLERVIEQRLDGVK